MGVGAHLMKSPSAPRRIAAQRWERRGSLRRDHSVLPSTLQRLGKGFIWHLTLKHHERILNTDSKPGNSEDGRSHELIPLLPERQKTFQKKNKVPFKEQRSQEMKEERRGCMWRCSFTQHTACPAPCGRGASRERLRARTCHEDVKLEPLLPKFGVLATATRPGQAGGRQPRSLPRAL